MKCCSVHFFELQSLIGTLQYARVRQSFQVEPFCSTWLTLPRGFPVVFTIYGSTRNFLRTSPCGRPFSRSERAFLFPRFYCNFLPRLGTIHGRRHVGPVWGLFYWLIVPGEMSPSRAFKAHQGYQHWMARTFSHSSGVHTLVPTFFWQANSILVR